LWISDAYTGLMDTTLGKLSVAGAWHLWFSVVEVGFVLMFMGIWILFWRAGLAAAFRHACKVWGIVVAFSALSVADFLIRHLYIFKETDLLGAFGRDWASLLSVMLSLLTLVNAKVAQRSLMLRISRQPKVGSASLLSKLAS
jgi:hypothetical protein